MVVTILFISQHSKFDTYEEAVISCTDFPGFKGKSTFCFLLENPPEKEGDFD